MQKNRATELAPVGANRSVEELSSLYRLTDRVYHARSLGEVYEAALDAIIETMGCDRASILLIDNEDVMRFVAWRGLSQRYREKLEGHSPWSKGDIDPPPIFVPDIRKSSEAEWIRREIALEGIVALGFIPLLIAGQVIGKFMIYYNSREELLPHRLALSQTIARQVSFSIERVRIEDSRRRAMTELRHSEERFRLMSENAPVMIWMSDPNGACEHLNRMLRQFWGVAEEEIANFDWRTTMHPDDAPEIIAAVAGAIAARESVQIVGRYRDAGGAWSVLETDARPRFGPDGRFLGMIGVNIDITERERTARQRELMLAELNHRVKNTLAVVQAIAYQTFREDRQRPSVAAFTRRIGVLARAHNLLTQQNWESTPLDQLVTGALADHRTDDRRFQISGPPITVNPKLALTIALALHELHTNALKYGALSVDPGRVSLTWQCDRVQEIDRLRLIWAETGGPRVEPPLRRGFGTSMIEDILARDIGGSVRLDFDLTGLVCSIDAPLATEVRE